MLVVIVLEQFAGAIPLEIVPTVIVEVADNERVVKVPVVPLKVIVAVLPLVVGLLVE